MQNYLQSLLNLYSLCYKTTKEVTVYVHIQCTRILAGPMGSFKNQLRVGISQVSIFICRSKLSFGRGAFSEPPNRELS